MVVPRVAAASLTVLALALGAASARADSAPAAPTGLHGFLLRADEPAQTSFPRTPAFAWNPVHAAASYEFQLSTSTAFRDSGIVWQCPSATCQALTTPVAAPNVSLPWITGSPHALWARVRAVMQDGGTSAWSDAFGFDVVPGSPPTPLAAAPGLLRWTPVAGASGYEVWLVDQKKFETVYTNVLDEREVYTFHEAPSWVGSVRWRVRALRADWNKGDRVNGIPVTQYGVWSPIYRSTNPNPPTGQIKLGSTLSDVVSSGRSSDLAHRLMPGFTWSGDQTLDGTTGELFRVYVFTDKQCLNRVFTSAVVGGQAYAPRPFGGLALPLNSADLLQARGSYLADLEARTKEQPSLTFDGEQVTSNEAQPAAVPTTSLPAAAGSSSATAGAPFLNVGAGTDLGAPISLWDDDWPTGGYYWTVVPVGVDFVGALGSTLAAAVPKGSTTVVVGGSPGFKVGDKIQIGAGTDTEVATVATIDGTTVTVAKELLNDHRAGEPIVRLGGSVVYHDLELPQDVCAAGRIGRFGITSEPTLVAGDDPFASGLSPTGRLTSAVHTSTFYKAPVISWTPALGAVAYQVQWSRKASPFRPEPGPGGSAGVLTGATSVVLPLGVGTWYYRVRGYDWSLPTGAQQMGWSDVARIVVANPSFKVIGPAAKAKRR